MNRQLQRQQPRRTLVTGGTGFIGVRLAKYLATQGRDVLILARHPPEPIPGCRFIASDVLDRDALLRICREFCPHEIVHLAAHSHFVQQDNPQGFRTNTQGTANVLEAVASTDSVDRCLMASSHVVDFDVPLPTDSGTHQRYADSKRAMEQLIAERQTDGKTVVIMRPCSIWGPGFGEPFFKFFIAVARGRYWHLGRKDPPKRLGYVGNTVFQILKLLDASSEKVDRRVFYLADYETTTIGTFAELIARNAHRHPPRVMPEFAVQAAARVGDGLRWIGVPEVPLFSFRLKNMRRDTSTVPIEETQKLAGPLPYSLEEGVAETLTWLRVAGHIP